MSRVVITAQQVKAALEATGYSSIESNVQAVLREIGKYKWHCHSNQHILQGQSPHQVR